MTARRVRITIAPIASQVLTLDCLNLGNVGTLLGNGDVILYGAGSYYAHNEMELGIWRCQWGQYFRARVYSQNYMRNYEATEPIEE